MGLRDFAIPRLDVQLASRAIQQRRHINPKEIPDHKDHNRANSADPTCG